MWLLFRELDHYCVLLIIDCRSKRVLWKCYALYDSRVAKIKLYFLNKKLSVRQRKCKNIYILSFQFSEYDSFLILQTTALIWFFLVGIMVHSYLRKCFIFPKSDKTFLIKENILLFRIIKMLPCQLPLARLTGDIFLGNKTELLKNVLFISSSLPIFWKPRWSLAGFMKLPSVFL